MDALKDGLYSWKFEQDVIDNVLEKAKDLLNEVDERIKKYVQCIYNSLDQKEKRISLQLYQKIILGIAYAYTNMHNWIEEDGLPSIEDSMKYLPQEIADSILFDEHNLRLYEKTYKRNMTDVEED